MFRTTLAGLRIHKIRLIATVLAVVLGVGFVAGTLIFGDTAKAALFDEFARQARGVDVAVQPPATSHRGDRNAAELPLSTLESLRALPGVARADGRMQETVPLLGKNGRLVANGDSPGIALSAGSVPELRPYDVTTGRAPAGAGEAAVDTETAARTGSLVGDLITVLDLHQHRQTLRLTGIVSFGDSKQYADRPVVILSQEDLVRLTGAHGFRQVVAAGSAGVPQSRLAARVAAALPGDQVQSGRQFRDALATDAINQLGTFLTVLLVFAIVACVVAAFVIYNTFTILIAQRVRELALWRCLGASRAQVFGSVVLESVVVGLGGGVLGIAVGVGIAVGLFNGAAALGAPLPSHAVVLTATPIVVALVVGGGVTVLAALVPAWRATRVAPLAALRTVPSGAVRPGRGRALLIVGAVLAGVAGTVLTVLGSRYDGTRQVATLLVVAGGMVNFLAVLLLSPLFVGPLTRVLGAIPGRVFGAPGKLAVANARRNPGRTAATTAALMIGVGLMTAASLAVATVKATTLEQLGQHYPVDYLLRTRGADGSAVGIPPEVAQRLRGRPQLAGVVEVRSAKADLDGAPVTLAAMGTAGDDGLLATSMPLVTGSVAGFGPGDIILSTSSVVANGRKVGDRVTVAVPGRPAATFTVVALADAGSLSGDALLSWAEFGGLHPVRVDDLDLVKAADGVRPADSRAAVESVTDDYPLVTVLSAADWRAEVTGSVDALITIIAALLGVAIVIALIGIMNTLALSVFERTRESALTRALGLTRGQLRACLLVEALLMGVVGAAVGIGFGLLYGWATTRVMFAGFAAVVSVPVGQVVGYLALAGVAAAAAAVLPARRAARVSIVSAMAES